MGFWFGFEGGLLRLFVLVGRLFVPVLLVFVLWGWRRIGLAILGGTG